MNRAVVQAVLVAFVQEVVWLVGGPVGIRPRFACYPLPAPTWFGAAIRLKSPQPRPYTRRPSPWSPVVLAQGNKTKYKSVLSWARGSCEIPTHRVRSVTCRLPINPLGNKDHLIIVARSDVLDGRGRCGGSGRKHPCRGNPTTGQEHSTLPETCHFTSPLLPCQKHAIGLILYLKNRAASNRKDALPRGCLEVARRAKPALAYQEALPIMYCCQARKTTPARCLPGIPVTGNSGDRIRFF